MRRLFADEWRQLAGVNRSDRPWEMPVTAALASGLPIFIGAAYGELGLGLAGSLGGLVFLHLPATRLSHRMAWLMACALGMTGSHALGMLGHGVPALVVPLLVIITILAIVQVPLGPWAVAGVLTSLALVVEVLVVRHYGLATDFITPLAILLVEAGQGSVMAPGERTKEIAQSDLRAGRSCRGRDRRRWPGLEAAGLSAARGRDNGGRRRAWTAATERDLIVWTEQRKGQRCAVLWALKQVPRMRIPCDGRAAPCGMPKSWAAEALLVHSTRGVSLFG